MVGSDDYAGTPRVVVRRLFKLGPCVDVGLLLRGYSSAARCYGWHCGSLPCQLPCPCVFADDGYVFELFVLKARLLVCKQCCTAQLAFAALQDVVVV